MFSKISNRFTCRWGSEMIQASLAFENHYYCDSVLIGQFLLSNEDTQYVSNKEAWGCDPLHRKYLGYNQIVYNLTDKEIIIKGDVLT